MPRELAKITNASLRIKEVQYESGSCQKIDGSAFNSSDKDFKLGTMNNCDIIRQFLFTLDIDDLDEIKGKIISIYGEDNDIEFKPAGLSKLQVDNGGDPFISVSQVSNIY